MASASGSSLDRWRRADEIFAQALDLPPDQWERFLDEACGEDEELRQRVAALLERSRSTDRFLSEPYLEVEPELAAELSAELEGRRAPRAPGERIGPYRIRGMLGRGGAGTVYLAEREGDERRRSFAVKVLRRGLDTEDFLARWRVEQYVLTALDHPNIARLLDAGQTDDGRPYLVLECVEGGPITEYCDERRLSVDDRLHLFLKVVRAVDYAHSNLVLHRDIKPSNVLVSEEGQLKLLDFGIAKLLHDEPLGGEAPRTKTGVRLLTPEYASPQQLRGEPVTPATDVYQLGLLLFELLTGIPPHEAMGRGREGKPAGNVLPLPAPSQALASLSEETLREVAARRGSDVDDLRRELRAADRLVASATAPDREERYTSAAALVADLERVLAGLPPRGARRSNAQRIRDRLSRPRDWSRTRQVATMTSLIVVIGLGLALADVMRSSPAAGETEPAAEVDSGMFDLTVPNWVLVGDFQGPDEAAGLAETVRELVVAALAQTGAVSPVPLDEVREALQMAGRADTSHVDQALARELALRNGFRVALTGRVVRLGAGYSLLATAVDPESGRAIASASENAESEDALLPGVERLATNVAEQLATSLGAARAVRPSFLLTTNSFEAYQVYLEYLEMLRHPSPDPTAVHDVLRKAVALDPGFAMAWRALAWRYNWFGMRDSARVSIDRALDLRERVTELERLHIEATEAFMERAYEDAIEINGRILQVNQRDEEAHHNRFRALRAAGRFEEALQHMEALQLLYPVSEGPRIAVFRWVTLMALGRVEEARELAPRLPEERRAQRETVMALAEGDWREAERIALHTKNDPDENDWRRKARWAIAGNLVARGAVGAADSVMGAIPAGTPAGRQKRILLALTTGCRQAAALPLQRPLAQASASQLLAEAALARVAGHDSLAAAWQERALSEPQERWSDHYVTLNGALEAAAAGEWRRVVSIAREKAWRGLPLVIGTTPLRWLVADAYERLGKPESAAVYFEKLTQWPRSDWREAYNRGFAYPFAHRRLALLYYDMGERERAEYHWNAFRATFSDADPELWWMLEESPFDTPPDRRRAVATAEAPLVSDDAPTCEAIAPARERSVRTTFANLARAQEAFFSREGRFAGGWEIQHLYDRGLEHSFQQSVWIEGDRDGWSAHLIDSRSGQLCRADARQNRDVSGTSDYHPQIICTELSPDEARRAVQAIVTTGAVLHRLASLQEAYFGEHGTFADASTLASGTDWAPAAGVNVSIVRADARELHAVATHPDSPRRCELRKAGTAPARMDCWDGASARP